MASGPNPTRGYSTPAKNWLQTDNDEKISTKKVNMYTLGSYRIRKMQLDSKRSSFVRVLNNYVGVGKNKVREVLPWQVEQKKKRGVRGNYVLIIKVLYEIASWFLVSPFYLRYDRVKNIYSVQPCHIIQRSGCVIVLLMSGISGIKTIHGMAKNVEANPGYIGVYFDVLNGLILQFTFYTVNYFLWFRRSYFVRYVRILQTSPLIAWSTLSPWKAAILPIIFWTLTLYLSTVWMIIVLGFAPGGTFESSYEGMARRIFWLKEETPVSHFLGLIAIVCTFYDALYIHVSFTLFGPCLLFCIHLVTQDFFKYGLGRTQKVEDVEEVMGLYENYREFIDAANAISSSLSVHFIFMMLTYHSIHLFDALNEPNLLWKLNTYAYLFILFNFLTTPTKTLLLGRLIKKWLRKDNNYRIITRQELYIILDDITNKRLGVKGGPFFTISPGFSGLIINQLLSYAMLISVGKRNSSL